MKQHITLEQWEQLINLHETKLHMMIDDVGGITTYKDLNIGKMIEVLNKHSKVYDIAVACGMGVSNMCGVLFMYMRPEEDEEKVFENLELCDALFQAIKYILEE